MAAMRKDQSDIADLGPIGIVREGLRIICAHAKVFAQIQLALMVDLAFLAITIHYLFYRNLQQPGPDPDFRALDRAIHFPELVRHVNNARSGSVPDALDTFLQLLASAASIISFHVALSLSLSATLHSVGLHYSGRAFSFVEVVRAVVPRLWMRLALTNSYYYLIDYSIMIVQATSSLLVVRLPKSWVDFGTSMSYDSAMVLMVCLRVVFTVASAVSVLDEEFGWASVTRSLRLLKGKKVEAGLFLLLFSVPAGIGLGFRIAVGGGYVLRGSLAMLLVGIAVYVGCATFMWQFGAVCSGVQFVSFKAFHDESFADSLRERRRGKLGYGGDIVGGSEVALVGVQSPADDTV